MLMTIWESSQMALRDKLQNGSHRKEKMEWNRQKLSHPAGLINVFSQSINSTLTKLN